MKEKELKILKSINVKHRESAWIEDFRVNESLRAEFMNVKFFVIHAF